MFPYSVNQFPTFLDPRDFSLKYHFSQIKSEMFITGYFLYESCKWGTYYVSKKSKGKMLNMLLLIREILLFKK